MISRGQLPSYLTVIGVHSTMHLMHPNYCQITIICSRLQVGKPIIHTHCMYMQVRTLICASFLEDSLGTFCGGLLATLPALPTGT